MRKGLIHIYTGNGKGKTTAALGLGIRAYGRGFKVLVVQFLKGADTGEIHTIEKLGPDFQLYRGTEIKKFTWNMTEEELRETRKKQQEILAYAKNAAMSGGWDLIILDEILGAIGTKMIDLEEVEEFARNKPESLELVLTGRNAPKELIELADYVSEINPVKHPLERGIPARIGIEN